MKITKKQFTEEAYLETRDFLIKSFNQHNHNWLIDRWNFCRYFAQSIHNTFATWLDTVGLWTDEDDRIIAVVHSEGENSGEAFFQIEDYEFDLELIIEFIEHAEKRYKAKDNEGQFLNLRVDPKSIEFRKILKSRAYVLLDWKEPTSVLSLSSKTDFSFKIPSNLRISDGNSVSDYQKGFAHGRAFGYYKNDEPDNDDGQNAFLLMKKAPDYNANLDLAILNEKNEVVSFATIWYDEINQIGILEPVGTIPNYRKMGLARALIYEGINRIKKVGASQLYVGSDQQFYKSIGFTVAYEKEIWQRRW